MARPDDKDDGGKQDIRKVTEQHEGIPGYLGNTMPSTPAGDDRKERDKDPDKRG